MNKYRLCFSKDGAMIYIGHLDLLKLFQRALKRSGLPVAYSAGFNPHQLVSFALPLPIGYSSAADYADIVFEREVSSFEPLAEQMPKGITVVSARALPPGERAAAALVEAALYEIRMPVPVTDAAVADVLAANEIIVSKKTKSGTAPADIRPDIISLQADGERITAMLSAGSARNLKPELLTGYMTAHEPLAVKRVDLYRRTADGYVSLIRK